MRNPHIPKRFHRQSGKFRYIFHSGLRRGWCSRATKGKKAVHRKNEREWYTNVGRSFRNNGTGEAFDQTGLAVFLPIDHTSSYYTIVIYGDSSLPETSSLSKMFQALEGGGGKNKSFLSLLSLKKNQPKIVHMTKRHILGGKFCYILAVGTVMYSRSLEHFFFTPLSLNLFILCN